MGGAGDSILTGGTGGDISPPSLLPT
ncbi:MAG UNVERIFIED_CONTAM: hypothetical protein LVR29_04555 [Microcystis novacekii LVE1205-3]